MSNSTQRFHPSPLIIPEIATYFICRIQNCYPNERSVFIKNFCNQFNERIDKLNQQNKDENIIHHNDDNIHVNDAINKQHQNKHNQHRQTKNRFYTDDDIYNFIKNKPWNDVLCLFLPHIIHQRFMCPFKDIQESFTKLIQHISKKTNLQISHLIPPHPMSGFLELSALKLPFECDSITNGSALTLTTTTNTNNKTISSESSTLFHEQLYSKFGRISHFELILSLHKDYLNDFTSLFYSLMYENNGPLALHCRQYLALMAASRYSCQPLILSLEFQFAKLNGDITWIKSGINSAPKKYQKLSKLNALLAHRPWAIKASHIAELVNGSNGIGAWSISEIVQSIIILITFHFLSAMYQGLCITPEIDQYYSSILDMKKNELNEINNLFVTSSTPKTPKTPICNVKSPQNGYKDIIDDDDDGDEAKFDSNSASITIMKNEEGEDDDPEETKMEQESCKNIVKLLCHTQQEILEDENVVGVAKKAFEQAASLSYVNLGYAAAVYRNSHSKKKSFDINNPHNPHNNDDDSLSMDCDPDMAPPSSSNNSSIGQGNEISDDIHATLGLQSKSSQTKLTTNDNDNDNVNGDFEGNKEEKNENDGDKVKVKIDNMEGIDINNNKENENDDKLTSANWKKLVELRKQNMLPMASDPSIINLDSITISSNGKSFPITNNLAKITNIDGAKRTLKSKKHKKIIPPTCQGTKYWKYSGNLDLKYTDFDCHKSPTIHCYDFNWEKHGFACLSRYYPGIEKKMDAVFHRAYTMTDFSINNKNDIDTEPFRIAIWHYTFRCYGVNNDSYDYRKVNVYLPVKLKIFIKKLVCYSQIVTIDDIKRMGITLQEKEKIHVAILALEAKKQACLLFALRAVMKYMQSPTT